MAAVLATNRRKDSQSQLARRASHPNRKPTTVPAVQAPATSFDSPEWKSTMYPNTAATTNSNAKATRNTAAVNQLKRRRIVANSDFRLCESDVDCAAFGEEEICSLMIGSFFARLARRNSLFQRPGDDRTADRQFGYSICRPAGRRSASPPPPRANPAPKPAVRLR